MRVTVTSRRASVAKARSKAGPATIDEYLATLRPDQRTAVQRLRQLIHAAAPGATECISYQIPAFRLHGQGLIWFGAAARHSALYGVSESYPGEFAAYDTSGKGTLRFPLGAALPAALIRTLVKARVARVSIKASSAAPKAGAPRRRKTVA